MRLAIYYHASKTYDTTVGVIGIEVNIKPIVQTSCISRFNSQHESKLSKCGNTDSSVTTTITAYECAQRTQQPPTPEGAQLDGPMRGPLYYCATNIGSLYTTFIIQLVEGQNGTKKA